jgi:hypothetical protein
MLERVRKEGGEEKETRAGDKQGREGSRNEERSRDLMPISSSSLYSFSNFSSVSLLRTPLMAL